MTYILLVLEFFKIGLLAIGGGLVTVPFLFDLADKYDWFSKQELADMIAISESTPGPIGVNMATFAGFNAGGIGGGILATLSLVLPSVIIMIIIAKVMGKYSCNVRVKDVLNGIRPAVLAMILFAGLELGKIVIVGNTEILFLAVIIAMMRIWKKSPIYYLCLSGVLGILLKTL
ncbi:MAG: chromate transporter [Alphaproteobacteria bacterium]|nr:chromate transporter [Alphaproteobacteria bacterium]MBE6467392.1 chromate transporter [Alphaproteobacteria bacterium]